MTTHSVPIAAEMYGHVYIDAKSQTDLLRKLKNPKFVENLTPDFDTELEESREVNFEGIFDMEHRHETKDWSLVDWSEHTLPKRTADYKQEMDILVNSLPDDLPQKEKLARLVENIYRFRV